MHSATRLFRLRAITRPQSMAALLAAMALAFAD
jgi:hypothetical protein